MSVPGSNILNQAARAIRLQTIQLYKNLGRVSNSAGIDIPSFAAPTAIKGSIQPVPRHKYEYLGLDFAKNYVNLYTSSCIQDLQRNKNGDEFTFGGQRFQCESQTQWGAIDGWSAVLSVEIPC